EYCFIIRIECKAYIIQYFLAIKTVCQPVDIKQIIADFTFWTESDKRILSGGRLDIIEFNFIKHLLAACCLLRLGSIGAETFNELFELLDLLFFFLVLFLSHLLGKLTGLKPEIIVAYIELYFTVVEVCNMGTYII